MKWIDEMFTGMENNQEPVPVKRNAGGTKVDRTERLKKQSPGALSAWSALLTSITSDVNEFNQHKQRAGQTAVCMSHGPLQCQVYLPGMHSKRLVLTLDNDGLEVSVHPDFPKQRSTITIELDKEGQHGSWVVGRLTRENAQLSAPELSEYLLKPILASADFNKRVSPPAIPEPRFILNAGYGWAGNFITVPRRTKRWTLVRDDRHTPG